MNSFSAIVPAPDDLWTKSRAVIFSIGPFPFTWYAFFIFMGFIVAIVLSCLKMRLRYKISIEPFIWYVLLGVPFSLIGAKIGSCIIGNSSWSEFFTVYGSGLAIQWGVALDVIISCIFFPLILRCKQYRVRDEFDQKHYVKKVSYWLYFDAVMPTILIAQFLGRWGNYFNQEIYGQIVTNQRLAWFLHDHLPFMYISGHYHQPLFLWEGLINLSCFFIIYFLIEIIPFRKAGDLGFCYFLVYGIVRICLEPLRYEIFHFHLSNIFAIIWIVTGVLGIVLNHLLFAKTRKLKWFSFIKNKTKEKINNIKYPFLIKKTKKQITKFSNCDNNLEKLNKLKKALKEYLNSWTKLKTFYHSTEYHNLFVRSEHEMLYYCKF